MQGGDGAASAPTGGTTPGGPRKSLITKAQLSGGASGDGEKDAKGGTRGTMVVGNTGSVLTGRKKSEFYNPVSTEQLMADEGDGTEDSESTDEEDQKKGNAEPRRSSTGSARNRGSQRTRRRATPNH